MHVKLKKKFGQNFLIDTNIINKINNLVEKKDKNILEIGPGSGSLTKYLVRDCPAKLVLIEIDKDLIDNLKLNFSNYENVRIINEDILKTKIFDFEKFDIVISNLPYNISSEVLFKLTLLKNRPTKMILMFQKEFAYKLLDNKLNALNSAIKCFYNIKKRFDVSKNCFRPIPNVESTVLEFDILSNFLIKEECVPKYLDFKRQIFNKKRKKIGSIIKDYSYYNITKELAELRAESMSLEEFIKLYNMINS